MVLHHVLIEDQLFQEAKLAQRDREKNIQSYTEQ